MQSLIRLLAVGTLATLVATAGYAADDTDGKLVVERAWARATAPGATVGATYLVIDNRAKRSDRLLAASSPRAAAVEVHATIKDLDQVRMRRVDPLHVGAGERLVLEPGGLHIMLIGLKSPLILGEHVPLTLKFERAGEIVVQVGVLAAGVLRMAR
jgi:copper(I)-binding protein